MSLTLAIQLGHNSTIAISNDLKILGSLSQEKIDNIKNSSSFPDGAIENLCSYLDISKSDITEILICGEQIYPPNPYDYKIINNKTVDKNFFIFISKKLLKQFKFNKIYEILRNYRQQSLNKNGKLYLKEKLDNISLGRKKIKFINHHNCHMASAFFSNKSVNYNEKHIIITIDGAGDKESCTISIYKDGNIKKIESTPQITSLGNFYSGVTRFLGMKPLEHEYKVMGLAPYANEKYADEIYNKIFKDIIKIDPNNSFKFISKIDCFDTFDFLTKTCLGYRFDNIAAAAQKLLENLIMKLISNLYNEYKIKNFCFGGGVFMNVKLNMKIQEQAFIKNAYFMPSCGDESNPMGAIYYQKKYIEKNNIEPLENLYLGLSYNNNELDISLKKYAKKFSYRFEENINDYVAEKLKENRIIARFSGRGEFGARSLGNRAILANPSKIENFNKINNFIKSRDFWMPFAPTILYEYAHLYLKNFNKVNTNSDCMITAFEGLDLAKKDFVAAIHSSDNTLRPQVIKKETNKNYYNLIKKFHKLTGIPGLLNTSFNLHGYPMVSNVEQALYAFENSDLEYLIIENYILKKK